MTDLETDLPPKAEAGFVLPPPQPVALPIAGQAERFAVRRIYCVGRNYADHAREMGHDPDREPPFFFQKNPDDLVTDGVFPYPPLSSDVHFEVELVAALAKGGAGISEEAALADVWGYAVGLDMTRRDLQGAAKKAGRPWEPGKAFAQSAPIGPIVPATRIGHPKAGAITLDVDGVRRQSGDLAAMIWSLPEVIAHLSCLFVLAPGDLIFTGTPAGVGPIQRGETMVAAVEGVGRLEVSVV
ncbi:MAG: fumarylacetoacetate hydrolase family protein [Pseudomonadota bacterium]